jgi:hypothetical protein
MAARGDEPTARELNEALRRFGDLLGKDSSEADFQQLFTDCPYIFSRTLPLHFEASDVVPLGRPGKAEPDFVVFPSERRPLGNYGIIELKRPDSKLFVRPPRVGTLELAEDVRTAVSQSRLYEERLLPGQLAYSSEQVVMLGTRSEIFIVAGLSPELAAALSSEIYRAQLNEKLPANCKLFPYDTLFDSFHASVPPRLLTLRPGPQFDADEYLFAGMRFRTVDPVGHPSLRGFSCGSSTHWEREVNMIVAGLYSGDREREAVVRVGEDADGTLVGVSASQAWASSQFAVASDVAGPSKYLSLIGVSERHRGSRTPKWHRYGDVLLRDALGVCSDDGDVPGILALVSPENRPARWLAERHGFEAVSDGMQSAVNGDHDELVYRPAGLPFEPLPRTTG